MYVDLSKLPSPPKKYQATLGSLYGGLNTARIPSEVGSSQCPELLNVLWRDGVLRSREGQELMQSDFNWDALHYENMVPNAMYEKAWHDNLIFSLFDTNYDSVSIYTYDLKKQEYKNLHEVSNVNDRFKHDVSTGSFFAFGDKLYYKHKNAYVEIVYIENTDKIVARNIEGYIPVIMINANSNGVGDLYQPENRITPWKEVWYNLETGLEYQEFACDGTTTLFYLSHKKPEQPQHGDLRNVVQVYIGAKLGVPEEDYTVNLIAGTISILKEPPAIGLKVTVTMLLYSFVYNLPVDEIDRSNDSYQIKVWVKDLATGEYQLYFQTANPSDNQYSYNGGQIVFDSKTNIGGEEAYKLDANVRNRFIKVQYAKSNQVARDIFYSCSLATTYGSTGIEANCVVMAGGESQPNAFFWSGNDENGTNPAYFPIEHYNLVGESDDPITAFGRQQNKLVIFQKRRVSSATYNFTTVDTRMTVSLNTMTINDKVGCDIPNSVQLIENNLVWANSRLGVMYLKDSTYAYETLVERISENVNEDSKVSDQKGLLSCLRNAKTVSSFDDGQRYWLCVGGNVFIWDYSLQGYTANTSKLCWFYADGIDAVAFAQDDVEVYGLLPKLKVDSWLMRFSDQLTDFGKPFKKVIRTQTQVFGTFESAKNVDTAVMTFNAAERVKAQIEYITEYQTKKDLCDIDSEAETEDQNVASTICVRIRKPKCLHVQQFAIRLSNEEACDLNLVSVQIFYSFLGSQIKAGRKM